MNEDWTPLQPLKTELASAPKRDFLPRVLVVDDNPRLIPLLKRTLEAGGFQAIFCTNGQQAWDYLLLNADMIDVLVTDVHMPIVSGLELIQRVLQTGWDIPMLVLTAQTQNQDLLRLEGSGVQEILTKPHGVKELPNRLSAVLERKGKLYAKRTGPAFEPDVPTILMVEDDPVFSLVIGNVFKKRVTGRMLSCGTVQQARYLMESLPLALMICDLNLPDGNSLGLISSLLDLQPDAKVVLITASRAPLLKHRTEALGFVRFLEKPIQPVELAELADSLLNPKKSRPINTTTSNIALNSSRKGARLEIEPLLDLRRHCQGRDSCSLLYTSGGQSGCVILDFGKIMHAESGALTGMPALGLIMSWDSASVAISPPPDPAPLTMPRRNWQSLLMDAFQYDTRFSQLPPNQVGAQRWGQKG